MLVSNINMKIIIFPIYNNYNYENNYNYVFYLYNYK